MCTMHFVVLFFSNGVSEIRIFLSDRLKNVMSLDLSSAEISQRNKSHWDKFSAAYAKKVL